MKKRLAIVTTHPIQYNAPFFKALYQTGEIDLMVFYTWDKGVGKKHDPGFGLAIDWDIPLLEGYPYCFVNNIAKDPGSHHHQGIICPSLIGELENFRPDAILVYGWNFNAHLKVMRHFKGKVPVWFRGDSTLLDYEAQSVSDLLISQTKGWFFEKLFQLLKFRLRKAYLTYIFKNIDIALYTGIHNKAYFKMHGLQDRQLVHIPHAVDNQFFGKDEEARSAEALKRRKDLGIPDDASVVLFAGKFEPKKDPEILVKGIIAWNEKHKTENQPLVHLLMVGNGQLGENLQNLAKGKSYIHWLPFQNQQNMPVIYRMCDLFCLPSQGPGETWGLAQNEAMACGKPVLASNKVGGAIDLVHEGKTGWIFKAGDQKHFLKTLNGIKEIKKEDIVKNIEGHFSISFNVKAMLEILNDKAYNIV